LSSIARLCIFYHKRKLDLRRSKLILNSRKDSLFPARQQPPPSFELVESKLLLLQSAALQKLLLALFLAPKQLSGLDSRQPCRRRRVVVARTTAF